MDYELPEMVRESITQLICKNKSLKDDEGQSFVFWLA